MEIYVKANMDHTHDLDLHSILKSSCGPSFHNTLWKLMEKANVDHAQDLTSHTVFKSSCGPSLYSTLRKLM